MTEAVSAASTFTPIPTFTSLSPPAAAPPPASAPETGYLLQEERLINGYAIRIWKNPDDQLGFDSILLIEATGQPAIRVDMVSALHDLTGSDLNGDGYPDLVVETYSGGAHCCFGTQVFSLRPAVAALILQKPETNAGGYFEDLDADGIFEFITYDDSFAYQYCPYAAGVTVKVIMAYNAGQDRYLPASPRFPEQYAEEIATHEGRAQYAPGELGEWDNTNICAILPLALDYLYAGQPDKAQAEFTSRYSGPDTAVKWNEVLQVVQSGPLYIP
ncbi:MAG: hypothetical protein JW963_08105 [Anaerolineales bacterium]|nr:hypothetical protein [Anaerolineales bacterium]